MTMATLSFRAIPGVALAGLCLLTAACTHGGESTSLEQSVAAPQPLHSQMLALAPSRETRSQPIVSLPEQSGTVESVRTHEYVDGLRQDILLRGGSIRTRHDSITVLARTDGRASLDERVPIYKPTEAGIRSELGGQFPHVAMQVAERDSSNSYGPYGLALGRVGDVRCLYMWQWIDSNRLPPEAGLVGPVSVRVRLCRADTTFDAMAALVDHLSIGGAGSQVASNDIHVISAPVEAPAALREKVAKTHHRKPHIAAVPHRTRVAHRDEDAMQTERHLMAPSPAQALAPRPALDQTASTGAANLASDLPSQAYLGPRASKAY